MNSFKKPHYFSEEPKFNRDGDNREFEDNFFYHKDLTNNDLQISED